ncbi:MAG: hypothetical protein LPK26_04850 [Bacillaceae bacterium]|nr:hypothetical protein [Bacillaceae bacterium]
MNQNRIEEALKKVIEKCESVINLENRPSDDHIELAEEILRIISQTTIQQK